MKNEKLMRSMGHIDDKYIEEASPLRAKAIKEKRFNNIIMGVVACICCAFTVLSVWLFLPTKATVPDVSEHKDSEYYAIVEKLNKKLYTQKPKYSNNFEKYIWSNISSFGFMAKKSDALDMNISTAPELLYNEILSTKENYEEITDNQVDGVIEADIIKRSDKYIYYLNGKELKVYSIAGEESELVGEYTFSKNMKKQAEFYLSKDCKTVTVIYEDSVYNNNRSVEIVALDVSDLTNIYEKKRVSIKGQYISSRYVNDELLFVTRFNAACADFSDESTFVPQIDTGDGYKSIPASCITMAQELTSTYYTFITKFDANTLELCDTAAYLSYSKNVYVTTENVYLTHGYTDEVNKIIYTSLIDKTDVVCLKYSGETFVKTGAITINGKINNQYNLDEYKGILRVVTTTDVDRKINAALYCVDLSKWEVVSSVVDFAPKGESVRSVRFDKDKAYVCTAIEFTDPVFYFDLSDINNITYKETEEIEGYSSSLVNFGNGYLLGIGYSKSNTLKLEIYKETTNAVESICKYEKKYTEFSQNYKSYYIDREKQLIGISMNSYKEGKTEYVLFKFDGYELVELVRQELDSDYRIHRGVLIDGYFYMFGENDFVVKNLNDN